jgi:flagellum-specific ATP synthase
MTFGLEMKQPTRLSPYFKRLAEKPAWRWNGCIVEASGQTLESEGPPCSVGECAEIVDCNGQKYQAEIIGFRGRNVLAMPLQATQGIRYGDILTAMGVIPSIAVGEGMKGRTLNALGAPLDKLPLHGVSDTWPLDGAIPHPMERWPIREPLSTGLRVLDGMLTVGRGQRIGVFGGSGVGKSTLIGMMTRNTAADITVVGLVGERGREVREFVEDSLGPEGMKRAVVVVSTADQSPLLRMRAALTATATAEFYASQGQHVLLVLDSLTRYAMAAREVGLAAGEPPASKGYTPSVFSRIAKLVERAGNFEHGSITAFYTVLMEGDDQQDPIVDSVRSFVDGHVVLSRSMAAAGWYPPINVLDSLSRLMPAITTDRHRAQAATVRRLMTAHARSEDLIRIGAYKAGADEELDRALRAMPALRSYLEQGSKERVGLEDAVSELESMEL